MQYGIKSRPYLVFYTLELNMTFNVALDVKVRKIQRAKEAKITIFDHPLSFGAPSPANPREYPHKIYPARK